MRVDVPHRKLGKVSLVRNALRMSDTPTEIHSASPELGEHTREVLAQLNVQT